MGSLAEGMGFSDGVLFGYQGDIAAIGSCVQLLCGAPPLMQDQPEKFAGDTILPALEVFKSPRWIRWDNSLITALPPLLPRYDTRLTHFKCCQTPSRANCCTGNSFPYLILSFSTSRLPTTLPQTTSSKQSKSR